MNLSQLSIYMDKDPTPYIQEYKKQIQSLTHLVNLKTQPDKLIRQTVDFLLRYSFLDNTLPQIILNIIPNINSYKLKTNLISSLFIMVHKKLITSYDLILIILENITDCPKYINAIKPLIKSTDKQLIINYYKTGTDKQKLFCYYFICTKFQEETDLICKGLFENSKIKKFCLNYLIESGFKLNKFYFNKLFNDINKLDSRENTILKMKVYCKCEDGKSIVPLALSMIDVSKDDIKELMNVVVDGCRVDDVLSVVKGIRKLFCCPYKEEEIVCYGMNLLREIYLKFCGKRKCDEDSSEEYNECIDGGDECIDGDDSEDECINSDDYSRCISDNECINSRCIGDNTSDNIKYNNENNKSNNINAKNNEDTKNTLILLKDDILNCVECFKGMKSKSINYSYRSVINAIKNKKHNNREIDFIRKKLSKEERKEKYKKVLSKEEKKEMYMRKSKRKFKLSKKNIRNKKK